MGFVWKLVQTSNCRFFTCIDFIKKNIIQYCETWYGSNYGGFVALFVEPTYLHIYDNESDNEKVDKDYSKEPWVVDMFRLMTPNDTSLNVEKEKDHDALPTPCRTQM
jgi:hypothetical protein